MALINVACDSHQFARSSESTSIIHFKKAGERTAPKSPKMQYLGRAEEKESILKFQPVPTIVRKTKHPPPSTPDKPSVSQAVTFT
jgi:hypothetical protein